MQEITNYSLSEKLPRILNYANQLNQQGETQNARKYIRDALIKHAKQLLEKQKSADIAWQQTTQEFLNFCENRFAYTYQSQLSHLPEIITTCLSQYPGFNPVIHKNGWISVFKKYSTLKADYFAIQITHKNIFRHCENTQIPDHLPNGRFHIVLKKKTGEDDSCYTVKKIIFYHGSLAHPERNEKSLIQRIRNIKNRVQKRQKILGDNIFDIRLTSPLNNTIESLANIFTRSLDTQELFDYYLGSIAAKKNNAPLIMFNYGVNAGRHHYSNLQTWMNVRSLNETFEAIFQETHISHDKFFIPIQKERNTLSKKINTLLTQTPPATINKLKECLATHHRKEQHTLKCYKDIWRAHYQNLSTTKTVTPLVTQFNDILQLIDNDNWLKHDSYILPTKLADLGNALKKPVTAGCIQAMDRTGMFAKILGTLKSWKQNFPLNAFMTRNYADSTGETWAAATAIPGFSETHLGVSYENLQKNDRDLAGTVDLKYILGTTTPEELNIYAIKLNKSTKNSKTKQWITQTFSNLALTLGLIATTTTAATTDPTNFSPDNYFVVKADDRSDNKDNFPKSPNSQRPIKDDDLFYETSSSENKNTTDDTSSGENPFLRSAANGELLNSNSVVATSPAQMKKNRERKISTGGIIPYSPAPSHYAENIQCTLFAHKNTLTPTALAELKNAAQMKALRLNLSSDTETSI